MQEAPWPQILSDLVSALTYRPGWRFVLQDIDRGQGSKGLTLDIITLGYNSRHPDRGPTYSVHHYMPIPPASYDRRSWQRWLFEQCLLVERHEACEFFCVGGEYPYAPSHGPGNDPYIVREVGTELDQRTKFTGEVLGAGRCPDCYGTGHDIPSEGYDPTMYEICRRCNGTGELGGPAKQPTKGEQ
jgi:hypothetical protein